MRLDFLTYLRFWRLALRGWQICRFIPIGVECIVGRDIRVQFICMILHINMWAIWVFWNYLFLTDFLENLLKVIYELDKSLFSCLLYYLVRWCFLYWLRDFPFRWDFVDSCSFICESFKLNNLTPSLRLLLPISILRSTEYNKLQSLYLVNIVEYIIIKVIYIKNVFINSIPIKKDINSKISC